MKRDTLFYTMELDWGRKPFSISRLETNIPVEETDIKESTSPKFTFLFLLEGEVLAIVQDESYLIRSGQLFLLPPDTPFSIHHFTALTGFEGFFDTSFLLDTSYPSIVSIKPILHSYWFDSAAFIAQLMDQMCLAYARNDKGFLVRSTDLLLYSIQTPEGWRSHPLVNHFMDLLFDRSHPLDSVSGYAARLGISAGYLNKLTRSQTHRSAMEWVEIARLNWAKTLLRDRSKAIVDIAEALGIDDPSYFTRFFKKGTGLTPSEYRRHIQTWAGKG